jgi:hypothetical protein
VIDPSAFLYAGTQQFTSTYYKRNSFIQAPIPGKAVSEEVKKLNITFL